MSVARADGSNDDKRRRLMSVAGADDWLSFDIFYPMLFGGRDRYVLRVRDLDGRERGVGVEAIDRAGRRAQSKPIGASSPDGVLWSYETRGRVGVLNMPDWALYESRWDWAGVAWKHGSRRWPLEV